ncbi:MAG: hypothetical protein DLM69_07030 [Candidatus Chloroheliales bacterium]|nr:MAG: hypothetical protein DLM69_07030 [Chloroflexota bacterium]
MQGNITMLNAKATQMMGFTLDGNIHHRPLVTKNADGSPYDDCDLPLSRTLAFGEHVASQHIVVQLSDGSGAIDVLTSTTPLFDANGKMTGAVAVHQDITTLITVERLKDEFFSMATHELRTPLTSITMSAGLLAELVGGQGGKVAGLARLVDDGAQRMRHLVDDLLDLSRLEHGRLTLYRRDFNLGAMVERASEAIIPLAERKEQQLIVTIPDGGGEVNADPTRIEQVVLNLLANAVKYTPEGGCIILSVTQGEGETAVSVADNGPGVPEDERERIFERFFRSKEDAAGATTGTGLGLPIARMLVELHGGRIWLEDAPGSGSVFRFTIPDGEIKDQR